MRGWATTVWMVVSVCLPAAGCSRSPAASGPVVVFVSVPPQASLVRQIGGSDVVVRCLIRPGQDPHVFEPTPRQTRALARAKVFLTVGIPFEEPALAKIRGHLPDLEVVDSAEGFARRPGCDCAHGHGDGRWDWDPHVWLSPDGLRIMAGNTARALARAEPARAADFRRRLKEVLDSIDEVDAGARAKLAPYRGRTVYVFHPAFGYFCDAYGLKQKAVQIEGRSPGSRQLRELIRQAKKDGARTIFVQEQFDQHGAKAVAAAIDGRVAVVDPLAEDVVANLGRIAEAIASGLNKK